MVDQRNNIQEARQLLQNALQGFDACETDAQRAEFARNLSCGLGRLVINPGFNPQDVEGDEVYIHQRLDQYFKYGAQMKRMRQAEVTRLRESVRQKMAENEEMKNPFEEDQGNDFLDREIEADFVALMMKRDQIARNDLVVPRLIESFN